MTKNREPYLPVNASDPQCYYTPGYRGLKQRISNFRLRVIRVMYGAKGVDRVVMLESTLGEKSNHVTIPAAALAQVNRFREFCLDCGGFVWMGTQKDLDMLVQDIAAECEALK